jgi:hypothetical protein
VGHGSPGWFLPEFVQRRTKAHRKLFGPPGSPIVQKDDHWASDCHVVMNGSDIKAVFP